LLRSLRTLTSTTLVSLSKFMSQTASAIRVRDSTSPARRASRDKKKELFGSQLQPLTGARGTLAQQVDFKVGQAKRLLRARRPAAQQRSHARQQFGKGERLYQIVVRAQFEPSYALVYGIASGQKKHQRAPAFLAQASENLPAIQPWEHHVENDEIELQFLREVQPIQSISGDIDDETRLPKSLLQELGGLGFIFDDQNSHE
jgi:hypothetical protein